MKIKKSIRIDNDDVSYYTNGVITELTILCIHGNSLDANIFQYQFENDSLNKYRLLALDLPGHGDSSMATNPEDTYNVIGYAKVITQFIAELKINRVVLVGHSLGGHIAIETTTLSNSIVGLFIFGTPPIGVPPAMENMFLPNPTMALAFKGELSKQEAIALAASYTLKENNFYNSILKTDGNARAFLGESIASSKYKNEVEICAKANFPLAILQADKDALVNCNYFEELKIPTLWNNKIHMIENSGHCPQFEQPDRVNNLLNQCILDV